MSDTTVLNGFMGGFAHTAEAAGLQGDQVRSLLELSVDLAQRSAHPAEFDTGFSPVMKAGAAHKGGR